MNLYGKCLIVDIIEKKIIVPKAVYGLFPANSLEDDILIPVIRLDC